MNELHVLGTLVMAAIPMVVRPVVYSNGVAGCTNL